MLAFKKNLDSSEFGNDYPLNEDDDLDNMFTDLKNNPYLSEFNQQSVLFNRPERVKSIDYSIPSNETPYNDINLNNIIGETTVNVDNTKGSIVHNNKNKHDPSTLRISTMTAVCNINIVIKLEDLYHNIKFLDDETLEDGYPYVKNCQFSNQPTKGYLVPVKSKRAKTKTKAKNCFQNQSTLIIGLSNTRQINLKIFRNGKIQMTGLKSEEEGYLAVNTLIKKITDISEKVSTFITSEVKTPVLTDFSIVLINSDFSAGFRIKREKLYELLFKSGMYVSYEPDIYPGVNAKYYWNVNNHKSDGICRCTGLCDGKGNGEGDGNCKKVTIATFQSGNVIITGARKNIQTKSAYDYINNIFSKNINDIIRNVTVEEEENIGQHKIKTAKRLSFNINKIINFDLLEKLKKICI